MCRHIAYVGPPVVVSSLVLDPPHSLEHQSHAPRLQVHSTVNADGFGVAWYAPEVRPEPVRYRTTTPIWADRSFASMAGVLRTPALLASARSATPPLPVDESGNAPFVDGVWAGSLNGFVRDFRGPAGVELRSRLSPGRAAMLEGNTDGETMCALVWDRIDAGHPPGEAVAGVVVEAEALGSGPKNLLITDGHRIAATAWGNSLFFLDGHGLAVDGLLVASEPLDDDPAWTAVPDGHGLDGVPGSVELSPLPLP